MNYIPNLTYQPLGDPLFLTYPWRLWISSKLLSREYRSFGPGPGPGRARVPGVSDKLDEKIAAELVAAEIEFRSFRFPKPNIRFRTDKDAMYFLLRYSNEA